MGTDSFGSRLRFARQKWRLSQTDLAKRAGVGVATIRRAENAYFEPRLDTARKLADALQVRVEWLLTGDEPMVWLSQMTVGAQHAAQNRPARKGLPGYVIVGPGPWFTDDGGDWQVE
jgi:transcriptional regulator with XRE-family HTH domain